MRFYPLTLSFFCVVAACATSSRDRDWIGSELIRRGIPSVDGRGAEAMVADGLDEREVVALALASSPSYRFELARIDTARADLREARRPVNPQLTIAGAFGPISAFATLLAPLESLWQLPRRSAAAAREVDAVADALVQTGLDLARDARLAHVECGLAQERVRVRASLAVTWAELARIAQARANAGETSPSEAATLAAEARVAADAQAVAVTDLAVALARLRLVIGLETDIAFEVRFTSIAVDPPALDALVTIARAMRPDTLSAASSLDAAVARAGWERARAVSFAAQVEGHWTRPDEYALRVGGRIELPIFGANPGGRGRAEAEIVRAEARVAITRQRVLFEIVEARSRATQALASLATYRTEVLPALDEALRIATLSYEVGDETYVVVLDVMRRIGDARLREAELVAESHRTSAQIERAVGARIERGP